MATDEVSPSIISRQEARTRGLKFFFTGQPCVRKHICERRVNGGDCVICSRIRQGCEENPLPRTQARKIALRDGAVTYAGSVCQKNSEHGPVRYTSNGACIVCDYNKSMARDQLRQIARKAHRAADPELAAWDAMTWEEKRQFHMRRWRKNNAEHVAAYDNEYKTKKLQEDINYKLIHALRTRVNRAVLRNSKAGSAVRDLGCTIAKFREHIEAQFRPGMTWDNWGVGPGKWHLDHIKPLAELDLRKREDFLVAAHWTNYRPLWSEENSGRRTNLGRGKLGASKQPAASP